MCLSATVPASLLLTLLPGQALSCVQAPVPACAQHLCPLGTFVHWALLPEGTSDSEGAQGPLLPPHMWPLAGTASKALFFFYSRVSFRLERNSRKAKVVPGPVGTGSGGRGGHAALVLCPLSHC